MKVRVVTYSLGVVLAGDAYLWTQLKNDAGTFYGTCKGDSLLYYRDDVLTDSEAAELFEAIVKARFG